VCPFLAHKLIIHSLARLAMTRVVLAEKAVNAAVI
jgi:hypothetical protein